jgi:hypothetical protein
MKHLTTLPFAHTVYVLPCREPRKREPFYSYTALIGLPL